MCKAQRTPTGDDVFVGHIDYSIWIPCAEKIRVVISPLRKENVTCHANQVISCIIFPEGWLY